MQHSMRDTFTQQPWRFRFAAAAALMLLTCGCNHRSAAMPPEAPALASATTSAQPQMPESAAKTMVAAPTNSAEAPTTAPPMDRRPTADRGPRRPGDAESITFDDLNIKMQADMVFRPFLLNDRVKELDGKRVAIKGYIHPGATGKGIKEFVLLRNLQCKFGAGGQADHLAQVFMRKGSTIDYRLEDVKIEGILKVQPFEGPDGNTWSIYRLEDTVAR
jgi:hypothetical protein